MKRTDKKGDWPTIVIAGCGFGGIALAIALKKADIHSFTIVEKSADIGGVWRDNSYPGAACDVPSRLYSFSFEQDYRWSRHYAPQPEIHAYLKHCVAKYGLEPHIRFHTEVESAAFDADAGGWTIMTTDGGRLEARVFVSATGLFNQPALPDIPGREDFKGTQFHSARWDHDCPLAGRTVAVIGTGASAIQFVPEIAPAVKRLYVFQRAPHYVLRRGDPGELPVETARSGRPPISRAIERLRIHCRFESGIRRRGSERLTRAGERVFRKFLESQVADPLLREKLTPQYPLGCKRVLRSDDWYDALQRPNVELVDCPIEAVLPTGVRTRDGRMRPAEVIIYGTGFTPTDYLAPMRLTGLGGRDLNQAWRDGAEAYLGITVAGFPNFFMLYGPNTNTSGSIIYMLESQARYIVSCIGKLRRSGARFMDVREATQRRFNERVQRRLGATVLVDDTCHSYFRMASGKVTTQWPGFMFEYRHRTRRIRTGDYDFTAPLQEGIP